MKRQIQQKQQIVFLCVSFSLNILEFELRHNWTGILVEADVFLYTKSLKLNRKSYQVKTNEKDVDFTLKMFYKNLNI